LAVDIPARGAEAALGWVGPGYDELHTQLEPGIAGRPNVSHADSRGVVLSSARELDLVHGIDGQWNWAQEQCSAVADVHHLCTLWHLKRTPQVADDIKAHVAAAITDSAHAPSFGSSL
jgi:hypothetical protein